MKEKKNIRIVNLIIGVIALLMGIMSLIELIQDIELLGFENALTQPMFSGLPPIYLFIIGMFIAGIFLVLTSFPSKKK